MSDFELLKQEMPFVPSNSTVWTNVLVKRRKIKRERSSGQKLGIKKSTIKSTDSCSTLLKQQQIVLKVSVLGLGLSTAHCYLLFQLCSVWNNA